MSDRQTCQGKSAREEDSNSMDMLCIVLFVLVIVLTLAGLAIF